MAQRASVAAEVRGLVASMGGVGSADWRLGLDRALPLLAALNVCSVLAGLAVGAHVTASGVFFASLAASVLIGSWVRSVGVANTFQSLKYLEAHLTSCFWLLHKDFLTLASPVTNFCSKLVYAFRVK